MKILVINGPNLNMLGVREPDHYGRETYADLVAKIQRHCAARGVEAEIFFGKESSFSFATPEGKTSGPNTEPFPSNDPQLF